MSNINVTGHSSIPTPPGADFESTLEALRQHPVPFITDLAHTYGDIVRLPFGTRDIYLLNHTDLIREIFLGGSETFAKRKDVATEESYLGGIAGMFPLFKKNLIATYAPTIVEAAVKTHEHWQALSQLQESPLIDIYREMMQTTVSIVCQILFQGNIGAESATIVDALLTMNVGYGFDTAAAILVDTVPPVAVSETPESQKARSYLLRVMQGLLDAYRSEPHKSDSLFSGLLAGQLNDEQITNISLSTFSAWHEVTVTTLSWTWYLLSQYPEVEAHLHAELTNVLGGCLPTWADMENLPYTQMLLKETRRLYPTVWLMGRFVRHDVSLGGHLIPANSIVLASQKVMHRDERYFANPDQFEPLRWTPEAVAARPEFTFFPFSAGPRQCLGRDFAWVEDTLILATLAQHWQARLVPDQVLEPHPQKSFAPRNGIQMML